MTDMKKINIILGLMLSILLLSSCEEWLDVNTDPNVPTEVSTDLILPAAQASLAVTYGGTLFNVGGFFAQYWAQAPEANQYNTIETYDLRTDFLDAEYREIFAAALNDLERIRTDASEVENWGDYLVATTLRAFAYQVWVDLVDKAPYSEALQGTEVVNPTWEDGDAVYNGLIEELDDAMALVAGDDAPTVSVSDMMLGADMDQWVGFANAMKLKLLMRQRFANDVSAEVTALISENNFMSVDVAFSGFQNEVNKRNPWYETTKQLNTDANHVATVNIVRFYNSNTDPRLTVIFEPAAATDSYEGIYPALKQVQQGLLTSDFSRPLLDESNATMPVYLYTMAELYLFIAEAELVFNNDKAAAKTAYEMAVDAGLAIHGLESGGLYATEDAPYYFDVNASNDDLFEQIMMQKWAALCAVNNLEAYNELRRTDIPKYFGNRSDFGEGTSYVAGQYLDPAKNLLSDGVHYPYRLPYPDVAVTRNSNTPSLTGTQSFENKVWWDVN